MSETVFKLAALGQGIVLLIILILVGLATAPKVGLRAPVFQALVTGESKWQALAPQIVPGLIGGLVGALLLLAYALLQPLVTPERVQADSPIEISMLMRVLYGGIVEELHMRWGLMSLFVWLGWRLFQRSKGLPHNAWFWAGIVLSALIFGIGHVPAAISFGMLSTPLRIGYIVLANTIGGLIFGWLYWRKGLEGAMIAHASTHIIAVWFFLPVLT